MVMPRSRSRSMESSTCARMSRDSTVCVISRMRSASVDFPWSMWAMIEKLRMRAWSAMRTLRLGADAEEALQRRDAARREAGGLVGLADLQPQHRAGVGQRAERDAAAHAADLADDRAADE